MHNEVDNTQKRVVVLGKMESSKDTVMDSFNCLEFSIYTYLYLKTLSPCFVYRDDE